MQTVIENEFLTVIIDHHGAELKSLVRKDTGQEYMWCGDAAYWGRTSPVLFPFVGSLKGKSYTYDGKQYQMGQHGFARDRDFALEEKGESECWFFLSADAASQEVYPFAFRLHLGYRLEGNSLRVLWKVENEDTKTMHFSIGGHPAFACPLDSAEKQTDGFIRFDTKGNLVRSVINGEGLVDGTKSVELEDEYLPITEHLFDADALVIEKNQSHRVSLCDKEKKPYLTVSFQAPLFGVWSPVKKNAPFICIEPWYGRCDGDKFHGTLEERDYGNVLRPGEKFEAEYQIIIEDL